jgi:hypothetical protein
MSDKTNKSSDPGAEPKEEYDESGHYQFKKKQAQTQNEPENFRSGKNVCDHNS